MSQFVTHKCSWKKLKALSLRINSGQMIRLLLFMSCLVISDSAGAR